MKQIGYLIYGAQGGPYEEFSKQDLTEADRKIGYTSAPVYTIEWQTDPYNTAPRDREIDLIVSGRRETGCKWMRHGFGREEWRGSHTVDRIFFGSAVTHWMDIPELPK